MDSFATIIAIYVTSRDARAYFMASTIYRTISRTGSFLALWAVVLVFFSVLGTNLFNSQQVR